MLKPEVVRAQPRTMDDKTALAERVLDEVILRAHNEGQWPCRMDVQRIGGTHIARHLVDKYAQAGWKIGYITDWRDGDYVQIEKP